MGRHERLLGRPLQRVWQRLAFLSLGAGLGQVPLLPPAGHTLASAARVVRPLRWHAGQRGRSQGGAIPASPTWLQLPARDLRQLIDLLYTEVMTVPVEVERERLERMGDPAAWGSQCHQLVAEMVRRSGLAEMLWSCAPVVLTMLRALWYSDQ